MLKVRILTAALCASAFVTSANGQNQSEAINAKTITAASEALEESNDLKLLKEGKWVVTAIERGGETIPAQFGQKEGDIITFQKQGDFHVLG